MTNAAVIIAAQRANAYMEVYQEGMEVFIDITAPFGRHWDFGDTSDSVIRASYIGREGRFSVNGVNVGNWSAMWEKLENVIHRGHHYYNHVTGKLE